MEMETDESAFEDAMNASGCTSVADFLSDPYCKRIRSITMRSMSRSNESYKVFGIPPLDLTFHIKGFKAREEAREAGSFVRFLHTLPAACRTLELDDVYFASKDELSALCNGIASPSCTLRELKLLGCHPSGVSIIDASHILIREALISNTSLQILCITSDLCSSKYLIPVLSSTSCSIGRLYITLMDGQMLDVLVGVLSGLAENTICLEDVRIKAHRYNLFSYSAFAIRLNQHVAQLLGEMLLTNNSLKYLHLEGLGLPGEAVTKLFTSLEKNRHLTHLHLNGCQGEGWPRISSVLDSLRVNGILGVLSLYGTKLEHQNAAAVEAQLGRNRENVEQLKELKSAQVELTIVRLFLCGLPYSGKTSLSLSLRKWNANPSSSVIHFFSRARYHKLKRTRGIEVTSLEKDGIKVSMWDLAGQKEYYSFHDCMFPNLSNEATPSLFLFVWNPIQIDLLTGREIRDQHGKIMTKTLDMFQDEFTFWLRFIASKTLKSIKFRPTVIIGITRGDHHLRITKSLIGKSFKDCQEKFKEYINMDTCGIFEMDARDPNQVKSLALHVFDCASKVLKSAPLVYKECDDARRLLSEMVHTRTIMTKEELYNDLFCWGLGINLMEVQEAIALSLNNSGDLIFLKSADLVVIDTQWFCHKFMGDLLHSDMKSERTIQVQGLLPLQSLEELLEMEANSTFVCKHGKRFRLAFWNTHKSLKSPKIRGEDLVKLLLGLGLACQQDDISDIFIPASLCTLKREQIYPSQYLKGDKGLIVAYMGRRLKCKDSICTFFTPGLFHLLQNTFDRILSGVVVTLEEDVIAFAIDGVQVLVEFCKQEGQDPFIDILIHSRRNLDDTIEWAYEEIIDKMERVCAEPRGIQGVELVHEVIRPGCVKDCFCLEDRRKQAVSIEELRSILSRRLEKRGFQPKFEEWLRNQLYTWQTTNCSDFLMDLLGDVETLKVIDSYKRKFIMDVKDALEINIETEVGSAIEQERKSFRSSVSGKEREWIFDEIQKVRKDVQEVRKEIQKVGEDMWKLCHAVLPKLEQRMHELLRFGKDGEAGKLPRIFLVTKDNGKGLRSLRRVVSAMVPGLQNVRLELLCEQRGQPHLVAQQRGINFATLEDGLLKRGMPYIMAFLKVANVAMKMSAHVVAGLGHSIPEFSSVLALVVDTPEFPGFSSTFSDLQAAPASRVNFQEGQQWLFDVLSKHNCCTSTQIHDVFGLSRVRYPDLQVGWLCDKHRHEGELCPI